MPLYTKLKSDACHSGNMVLICQDKEHNVASTLCGSCPECFLHDFFFVTHNFSSTERFCMSMCVCIWVKVCCLHTLNKTNLDPVRPTVTVCHIQMFNYDSSETQGQQVVIQYKHYGETAAADVATEYIPMHSLLPLQFTLIPLKPASPECQPCWASKE